MGVTGDVRAQQAKAYALSKVGMGYIYGATGWVCTPARREQQAKQYPQYADIIMNTGKKWDGKQCFDCAQLVRLAMKEAGVTLPSGATSQWNASGVWENKGEIRTRPESVCAVFRYEVFTKRMQHVGLYIGNGQVVEARGTAQGVILSNVTQYNWTHWAQPVWTGGVNVQTPYLGTVKTNKGNGISLWKTNEKKAEDKLTDVPEGAEVRVTGVKDEKGFAPAEYWGKKGVADTQYLIRLRPDEGAEGAPDDGVNWDAMLKEIREVIIKYTRREGGQV